MVLRSVSFGCTVDTSLGYTRTRRDIKTRGEEAHRGEAQMHKDAQTHNSCTYIIYHIHKTHTSTPEDSLIEEIWEAVRTVAS